MKIRLGRCVIVCRVISVRIGTAAPNCRFECGLTKNIPIMLKLQSITNDPLTHTAMIRFCEVFDDHPQVSVAMKLSTLDTQTQAEVQHAIKALARALLSEATSLCI